MGSAAQLPWGLADRQRSDLLRYLPGQVFLSGELGGRAPGPGPHLPFAEVFAAVLVSVAITTGAFVVRRKCPYLLVGWFWYLGMLLPAIGLVQFGAQTVADRFTYLPQIGLCVALAWAVADACRSSSRRRWAGGLISALVLAVLMGAAWRQTSFSRDSESLWTHTLACTSRNALAHYDLGLALVNRGRLDDALAHYQKAVGIDPDYADAHNGMAVILATRGQLPEALSHYQAALKIAPESAEFHNNLAYTLACQGRFAEAVPHYRKVLELDPRYAVAHNNYGAILAQQGRFAEAIAHYRQRTRCTARLCRAPLLPGLAVGNLSRGVAAQRRRGDRTCPAGRTTLWRAAERTRLSGRRLRGNGKVSRGHRHRPPRAQFGHPTEQSDRGEPRAGADRPVRGRKALS